MDRFALVIGVGEYSHKPLPNAVADARRVTTTLKSRGFVTTLIENSDELRIREALTSWSKEVSQAKIALVYLAGHAVERSGAGYFLPRDFSFPVSAVMVKHHGIGLGSVVEAVRWARSGIVILDACRNWPASRDDEIQLERQLDQIAASQREWKNVLLAYSTSSSDTASDGPAGQGSMFSDAFCRHALDHNISVDECFRRISHEVRRGSRNQQPWTYSSLEQDLAFTDLPKFHVSQRHVVPSGGSWCVLDHDREGILAGADGESVWHIAPNAARKACYIAGKRIVGAATPKEHLVVATEEGKIYIDARKYDLVADTGSRQSRGLATSPDAKRITHYGKNSVSVFCVEGRRFKRICQFTTDFEIYCCAYISDHIMWIAGERGRIASVDLNQSKPTHVKLANLGVHINAMALSHDRTRVYCAGQASSLAVLTLSGALVERMFENRKPTTPAGIRASLSQLASEETIHTYLSNRNDLPEETVVLLEESISPIAFASCAHAPELPIVAVGTDESTVLLIDTRDGQIIQELEIANRAPGSISGLAFLSHGKLAALCYDGGMAFLSPKF